MTLDKAIEIYEKGTKLTWNGKPTVEAEECQQMAEWLKDYKRCGDAISRLDKIQQTLDALDKEVADKEVTRDYWEGFCKVFNAVEVALIENSD